MKNVHHWLKNLSGVVRNQIIHILQPLQDANFQIAVPGFTDSVGHVERQHITDQPSFLSNNRFTIRCRAAGIREIIPF